MALRNVSVISVYVSDQDKALDFYVNKLGFAPGTDATFGEGMRWLEVKPPEGELVVALCDGKAYGKEDLVGKNLGYCFYSNDVRGTCEELKGKGVQITEEPNDQPWGVQAQFADLDGNGFAVVGG